MQLPKIADVKARNIRNIKTYVGTRIPYLPRRSDLPGIFFMPVGVRSLVRFWGIVAATATALLAQGAAAQTVYADGQPGVVGGYRQLPVMVTASVGGHCGFATGSAPSGTYTQPDFDVVGLNHDFSFALDCTGPSRVAVVSANGGLLTGGTVPTGYTTLAPYDVALNVVGSTATATGSCPVATLTATSGAPCTFRGPVSQSQGLLLNSTSVNQPGTYLRVTAPAYAGSSALVGGSYSDTLTVTVSAAS